MEEILWSLGTRGRNYRNGEGGGRILYQKEVMQEGQRGSDEGEAVSLAGYGQER